MNRIPLRCTVLAALLIAASLSGSRGAAAQVPSEDITVETLPEPSPHWVWLNDIAFNHMPDGRAYLVNGDTGKFLGMVSGGYGHAVMGFAADRNELYTADTYYSRGTRGERTDVITIYDTGTLTPVGEVEIPPKRFQGMPTVGMFQLTDDRRLGLVYNYTPSQSVSVVDLKERKLVGEYDTGGCALIFPVGPRRFFMLCSDGSLMEVVLGDAGELVERVDHKPFFDVSEDPLTEKPVRVGDTWYFVSFHNRVYPIRGTGDGVKIGEPWSLTTDAQFEKGWRIGGNQLLAAHEESGRLYALMHKGGPASHKDPGTQIWVFDLAKKKRINRIQLKRPASAIAVSQDDEPLLYAILIGDPTLHIHDAGSGKLLRKVGQLGATMTVIQPPPMIQE